MGDDRETLGDTVPDTGRGSVALIAGQRIGKFVVIETLGRGAMGAVFAAFDPDLDRKVALKLLRQPAHRQADPTAATARLLREARAMAKVSHSHVLAIHEVGTFDGQVFLAMEYAGGGTLRAWCAAEPRTRQELVARFVQAGRGLQAAHEAGLVHRDFKPENVLLTKDGTVRVADFGIVGRSHGEPAAIDPPPAPDELEMSLTRTGTLLGTPAYMAPEQHRCEEAGPAADQFAFCVALWEALYGVRPFAGATYGELAVNVLEDRVSEPPAEREVPRWLRDVVRRGLHARVSERWPSMAALLAALEHDPVAVRRRRLQWGVGAAAVLGLAGVAAYGLWRGRAGSACDDVAGEIESVWNATRAQRLHASFVETKRPYAEDTYARVAQRLDAYTRDWIAARSEACKLGAESSRLVCLEGRRAELAALIDVLAKAPTVGVLAEAVQAVDRLLPVSGCSDPATLAAITRPADVAARAKFDVLREQLAATRALHISGQHREALAAITPLVAEAERIEFKPVLAAALSLRANIELQLGDGAAAEATLRRTLDIASEVQDDALVVGTWSSLIYVVGTLRGRPAEALQMRTAAEAALRRAGRKPEAEAVLLIQVGYVLGAQHDFDAANAVFEQAFALMQRAGGPDDLRTGIVMYALGDAALKRKDVRRATAQLERSLAILDKTLGPRHPMVANAVREYGRALTASGRHEDAARAFTRSLDLARADSEESVEIANLERRLGYELLVLRRITDARPHLERAVALREKLAGADDPATANALNDLGKLALDEGKPAEAIAAQERVRAVFEKHAPGTPRLAECLHDLAEARLAAGDPARAREAAERAIGLGEATQAAPAVLAPTKFVLARALWEAGEHVRAVELARQAQAAFDPRASLTFTGQDGRANDRLAAEMAAWLAGRPDRDTVRR
ncbi:MAG TPA: serine/threonine-protein kinase [Kofleriaceae bacterium]|nr:serine/threonine-protein kinase [Kofleriaceae bacterium]